MSGITQGLSQTGAFLSANPPSMMTRISRGLRSALSRSRARRVVAGLTDAQLRDIGIDRSRVLGNKPMIDIDAGVSAYLMSIR